MDFSQHAKEPIDLAHFTWLGFKNENGALIKDDFNGEIQYYNKSFWFCQENKAVKKIVLKEDIDNIYLAQKYGR